MNIETLAPELDGVARRHTESVAGQTRTSDIEQDLIDCQGMADALLTITLYQAEYRQELSKGYSGGVYLASELKSRLEAVYDRLGA